MLDLLVCLGFKLSDIKAYVNKDTGYFKIILHAQSNFMLFFLFINNFLLQVEEKRGKCI